MKKLFLLSLLSFSLFFTACESEEDDILPPPPADPIVGTWVSEGMNIPLGLRMAPFRAKKIVATFNENKTYTAIQTDSANVNTTFTGTYQFTESTNTDTLSTTGTKGAKIFSITLNQASPSAVIAQGVFAILGTNMTYEVIQTTPALTGVSAPTAAGGFGSTTIAGARNPFFIQKYVKQ
ncbi:MAG: hypothetical protein C0425_01585 [Chlorobiaceae bacterium]|nr:hypothetical protein [Chlorobiaceae bacterium]MBA4309011.1 hypothetical protein [Chlorobiaceae bacterium]